MMGMIDSDVVWVMMRILPSIIDSGSCVRKQIVSKTAVCGISV